MDTGYCRGSVQQRFIQNAADNTLRKINVMNGVTQDKTLNVRLRRHHATQIGTSIPNHQKARDIPRAFLVSCPNMGFTPLNMKYPHFIRIYNQYY